MMEFFKNMNLADIADKLKNKSLTEEEFAALQNWMAENFKDPFVNDLMDTHWQQTKNTTADVDDFRINQILSRIHQKIHDDNSGKTIKISRWYNYLLRVAAVLVLPLLLSTLYFYTRQQNVIHDYITSQGVLQSVEVAPGVRSHFFLPDSSEVWLNSQSSIEFSSNLANETQRKVKLKGQAYFSVKHNNNQPFMVEAENLQVRVLGTSFDLSAYPNDYFITTTLEEGKVDVVDENENSLLVLNPGQQSFLDKKQQKIWKQQVETSIFTSWKDGFLIFRETPISQVAKQLERWYNCKINLSEGVANSEFRYTATIHDEILDEVLKMIQLTTPINYTIKNRNVTIW